MPTPMIRIYCEWRQKKRCTCPSFRLNIMSCIKFTSSALYHQQTARAVRSEDTKPKWSNKSSNSNTTCEISVVNTAQCELKSLRVSLNAIALICFSAFAFRVQAEAMLYYTIGSFVIVFFALHPIISNQVCVNFTCTCISVAVSTRCVYSSLACSSFFYSLISMMICDVSIITVLLSSCTSLPVRANNNQARIQVATRTLNSN